MEILWTAIGISVIVCFVLYVLAERWGRVLQKHNVAIRLLSDRLRMVEEIDNPQFRERLSESIPPPLEQVHTFSFRFSDRFWSDTLGLCDIDWNFVRTFGTFVGSVKLQIWRSHTVATITEVLPNRKTAAWQTRSLEHYPARAGEAISLSLWEVPLSRSKGCETPARLELALRENALELFVSRCAQTRSNNGNSSAEEAVFFRAPLDAEALAPFRTGDPTVPTNSNGPDEPYAAPAFSWQTFYRWSDDSRGLEWQLHMRNLSRKAEWDRWKILHSTTELPVRNGL